MAINRLTFGGHILFFYGRNFTNFVVFIFTSYDGKIKVNRFEYIYKGNKHILFCYG